jgi:hypothetical protein
MPLMRCPACQGSVASDAATCPHCGHPLPPGEYERQVRAAQAERARRRKAFLFLIAAVAVLAVANSLAKACRSGPDAASTVSSVPKIEYQVVQEWTIPGGGFGHVIVIDSTKADEAGIRQLGEQLRQERPDAKHVNVDIYDNEQAARMRQAGMSEKLPKKQQAFHDRHRLGIYQRNRTTGSERLIFAPGGMITDPGNWVEVKYSEARSR